MRKGELSEHNTQSVEKLRPSAGGAATVLQRFRFWLRRFAQVLLPPSTIRVLEQYPILPCKPTPSEEGLNNTQKVAIWSRCTYYL